MASCGAWQRPEEASSRAEAELRAGSMRMLGAVVGGGEDRAGQ